MYLLEGAREQEEAGGPQVCMRVGMALRVIVTNEGTAYSIKVVGMIARGGVFMCVIRE